MPGAAQKVRLQARLVAVAAERPLRPLSAPAAVPQRAELAEVVAAEVVARPQQAAEAVAAKSAGAVPASRCLRYSDLFP